MATVSDEQLLKRVAAGPAGDAFGEFYDRHHRRMVTFFFFRTMSEEVSADLAAETFASALKDAHHFDSGRAPARAWLQGIARNQLRQYFRRGRVDQRALRRLGVDPHVTEDGFERVDTLIDCAAGRSQVVAALRDLRPKTRDAVWLRVVLDRPYEYVASELGITTGAARLRVMRGLEQLGLGVDRSAG